jgi:hypothetical protein
MLFLCEDKYYGVNFQWTSTGLSTSRYATETLYTTLSQVKSEFSCSYRGLRTYHVVSGRTYNLAWQIWCISPIRHGNIRLHTAQAWIFYIQLLPIFVGRVAQSVLRLATGWTVRGSNPGGGEIFYICPDRPCGPPSLLYNGYLVFTGGRKRPGRDADPLTFF